MNYDRGLSEKIIGGSAVHSDLTRNKAARNLNEDLGLNDERKAHQLVPKFFEKRENGNLYVHPADYAIRLERWETENSVATC